MRFPITMIILAGGLVGIALSHGNGSCGLILVSGERAFVSSCYIMHLLVLGR